MKNNFTEEEIKTANQVKSEMLKPETPDELKAIYMAGEICMYEELKYSRAQEQPRLEEGAVLINVESPDCNNLIVNPTPSAAMPSEQEVHNAAEEKEKYHLGNMQKQYGHTHLVEFAAMCCGNSFADGIQWLRDRLQSSPKAKEDVK